MVRHTTTDDDESTTNDHSIGNVRAVFAAGKAIRSTDPLFGTTVFYRPNDADRPRAFKPAEYDGPVTVDFDTVRRNIDDDRTVVETVGVDKSAFPTE